MEQRSANFELPSSLNIGASYDFLFEENTHRFTVAANFASMAFSYDQYTLGLEYGFGKIFMLRSGYTYENKITGSIYDENSAETMFEGFSAGASVIAPLGTSNQNPDGRSLSIDYAFRLTKIMSGIHTIGLVLTL